MYLNAYKGTLVNKSYYIYSGKIFNEEAHHILVVLEKVNLQPYL